MAGMDKELLKKLFTEDKMTITQIAAQFEVSNQAVHRVLKAMGLKRADGGKAAQMVERAKQVEDGAGVGIFTKHGCTKVQWEYLRGLDPEYKNTPLAVYHTFKNNYITLNPGSLFQLPLWDWWSLWQESGLWGRHKRNPEGMYILIAKDRTLPLTKDNAHIMPFGDRLRESRLKIAA